MLVSWVCLGMNVCKINIEGEGAQKSANVSIIITGNVELFLGRLEFNASTTLVNN